MPAQMFLVPALLATLMVALMPRAKRTWLDEPYWQDLEAVCGLASTR